MPRWERRSNFVILDNKSQIAYVIEVCYSIMTVERISSYKLVNPKYDNDQTQPMSDEFDEELTLK